MSFTRRPLTVISWPPPQENNSLATTPSQQEPPPPSPDPSVNLVDGQGGKNDALQQFVQSSGPSRNTLILVAVLAGYYLYSRHSAHEYQE